MNATLRRMAGIDGWTDYEGKQEASIDKDVRFDPEKHDAKTWHKEPVFSEFFVGYGTGMSGIDAMRASAENYKRMCAERGLKPKFEDFSDNENYFDVFIALGVVLLKLSDTTFAPFLGSLLLLISAIAYIINSIIDHNMTLVTVIVTKFLSRPPCSATRCWHRSSIL